MSNHRGQMTPVKALALVGVMMLFLSAFTMWAITNQNPSGSPGLGAVDFSETPDTNSITVTVIESGSADKFVIETNSGRTKQLDSDSGESITIENVNSVTVYGLSDGERTEINSYTATWAN